MADHPSGVATADTATSTPLRAGPGPRFPARVALAAIAGAWVLAIAVEVGGYGHRLHHHELVGAPDPPWVVLGLFLVAWQAHMAAMMLPASMPLITLFHRVSAGQPRPHAARAAFMGGYLAVWTVFGVAALAGDAVVHEVVDRWHWLADRSHLIGGSVLVLAGAFQFSSLKDRCLRQCRNPSTFLATRYQRGAAAAFALGRRHGLFCVGCCWALMLVMFTVGMANLAWMAPLALLMLYEKAGRGAERWVRPIGVALIVLGTLVLLEPAWLPAIFVPHDH